MTENKDSARSAERRTKKESALRGMRPWWELFVGVGALVAGAALPGLDERYQPFVGGTLATVLFAGMAVAMVKSFARRQPWRGAGWAALMVLFVCALWFLLSAKGPRSF